MSSIEIPNISKSLFWDTDFSQIDWDKNQRAVIERVVDMGNLSDWRELVRYYGYEKIKENALQSRYFNNKAFGFLAVYFGLSPEQFRCYTYKQLNKGHWNY